MASLMFDISFIKQESKNDCGPTALKMVFSYFGENIDRKKIIELVDPEPSGAIWTLALAKVAAQLGFQTEFYSSDLNGNSNNSDLDFYKTETSGKEASEAKLNRIKKECLKYKVSLIEKELSLEEIKTKINKDTSSMVLLNWNVIQGQPGFPGHFVLITEYEEEHIYVHNQGQLNPLANLKIRKEIFEKARKSKGID